MQAKLEHFSHPNIIKKKFCQTASKIAQGIPQRASRDQLLDVAPAIPHIVEAATYLQDWLHDTDLVVPYTGLGWFYYSQGAYERAESWLLKGYSVSQKRLGEEHLDVAASLDNLSTIYWNKGRYSEAELFCQRAIKIRRKLLDDNHLDIAQSLNTLGI
ncbi:MAG: tetratricopeptide repeat protein, partial [Cyanobacteria bacterium J06634_6]